MTQAQAAIPIAASMPDDGGPAEFLVALGCALSTYGTPSVRIEETLSTCAEFLGVEASFFSLPTSLFASIGSGRAQQTFMNRVEPGEIDLAKLVRLDEVFNEVCDKRLSPEEGLAAVREVQNESSPPRAWQTLLVFGLVGVCVARFFGGAFNEMIAAGVIGFAVGALYEAGQRRARLRRVLDFLSGLLAAALASVATLVLGPLDTTSVALASLIILVPGLTLTLGVSDLAARHLVSGTARLVGAVTVLVAIGLGTAVGTRLGALAEPVTRVAPTPPAWTEPVALIVSVVCIATLFRARTRDIPVIMLGAFAAFFGSRLGIGLLGPELGVGIGAFLVGGVANAHARLTHRPAAVVTLPGILLLVPGAVGFRSFTQFVSESTVAGLDTAVSVGLIAASLVTGLLLAAAAIPPRKIL